MLQRTGFADARMLGTTGYHTSPYTEGTLYRAIKPLRQS
jgi:hypothetical protein